MTKETIFKQSITNAAAITQGSSWVGMYRFRRDDIDREQYPPFNAMTIHNSSSQAAVLRLGTNNEGGEPLIQIPANSKLNIEPGDAYAFYDFDVMNLDAATDIAIGSITGFASVVRGE